MSQRSLRATPTPSTRQGDCSSSPDTSENTTSTLPTVAQPTTMWQRPGQICLRVCGGPDEGTVFKVDAGSVQQVQGGRSRYGEIVLNDEHVSGVHFELALDSRENLILTDRGSTNGVFVDNVRVLQAPLQPGSTFRVGESFLQLLSAEPVAVKVSARPQFGAVFGESPVMRELFAKLEKIAAIDRKIDRRLPVLLTGSTGTGKELVARELHAHSKRRDGPFVAINCAAIPAGLAESFFFGHRRGAFTSANEQLGCFEAASGGTLFLDEIGELPLEIQPKLLRVLQEGVIHRVGEHQPRSVDVRLFSATHRDLRRMVSDGEFREDLYFRLRGVVVSIPDLAARVDDIIPLAKRFLAQLAKNADANVELGESAYSALQAHPWPGNVRELRRVIETAYCLTESSKIEAAELGLEPGRDPSATVEFPEAIFNENIKEARAGFERLYYRRLLSTPGTLAEKAKRAGISTEGLRLVRKRYNLDA